MIDPLAFGSTLCVLWRKDLASAWSWGRSAGALWIRFATLYTWVQDQPQLTQVPPIPLSSILKVGETEDSYRWPMWASEKSLRKWVAAQKPLE